MPKLHDDRWCMSKFEIKTVGPDDADRLWIAVGFALEWRASKLDIAQVQSDVRLRPIVEHWGRDGDIGVAGYVSGDEFAGAAWVRIYEMGEVPGVVKVGVPALAIGVLPEFREMGLGTLLLSELMA